MTKYPETLVGDRYVEFIGTNVPIKDILLQKSTKVLLNQWQVVLSRMLNRTAVCYHLNFECRDRHVALTYILAEKHAEEISWIIIQTIEANGTYWRSL